MVPWGGNNRQELKGSKSTLFCKWLPEFTKRIKEQVLCDPIVPAPSRQDVIDYIRIFVTSTHTIYECKGRVGFSFPLSRFNFEDFSNWSKFLKALSYTGPWYPSQASEWIFPTHQVPVHHIHCFGIVFPMSGYRTMCLSISKSNTFRISWNIARNYI